MAYLTQGSMCNAQTYTTPHHDRIQKLSQRLSGLQVGLETEKNTRLECLQSRLLDVDDRLTNSQDVSAKRFAMLKEQLSRYQVELEEERAAREKLAEDRQRDVAVLDQKVCEDFQVHLRLNNRKEGQLNPSCLGYSRKRQMCLGTK
eukprot:GHVR01140414.1.p1 GENE.GHVR01140414.1~~GHVR01140414.1.p1  ORF type:complete len:157 (-),score=27.12 GHVR01140414.1:528-965(-)